jgi:hypothetical protein
MHALIEGCKRIRASPRLAYTASAPVLILRASPLPTSLSVPPATTPPTTLSPSADPLFFPRRSAIPSWLTSLLNGPLPEPSLRPPVLDTMPLQPPVLETLPTPTNLPLPTSTFPSNSLFDNAEPRLLSPPAFILGPALDTAPLSPVPPPISPLTADHEHLDIAPSSPIPSATSSLRLLSLDSPPRSPSTSTRPITRSRPSHEIILDLAPDPHPLLSSIQIRLEKIKRNAERARKA